MNYKLHGVGEWGVVRDGAVRMSAAHRQVPLPTPHAFQFCGTPIRLCTDNCIRGDLRRIAAT